MFKMLGGIVMITEHDILRDYLANQGLKKTQPRHDILDAFLDSDGHITAYELHSMLQKRHQGIGFSTVYRTLKILTECGVAIEVNFGDGQARFEKAFKRENHGHLICTSCGRTEEFNTREVDKIKSKITGKAGFKEQGYRFEIYGLCSKCRK
jgi:Fur family transcriptional regulator, ferric uptake regulator